jgi:hypothetical protein
MEAMKRYSLTGETYREYELASGKVYRINKPIALFTHPKATTHRVLDSTGMVHCVPFPGEGTVLRWKPVNKLNPVQF